MSWDLVYNLYCSQPPGGDTGTLYINASVTNTLIEPIMQYCIMSMFIGVTLHTFAKDTSSVN